MTYGTPADPLRARWRHRQALRAAGGVALGVGSVLAGALLGYVLLGWLP